ncbi:YhcH/YjgK/YiaL family protein [Mucilaginibacter ginkgonis]|uniref:YhcH/YjgK/YiaL family protein n=1 Tax=Mucilaginibacter ginkgonis TaxID=2682091 RepID=A0A6I4HV96_9SPHI|nr:YhcH/YjgK/YiaL family protein [Mucilaginibacter ginkgonis]QQL50442.1 YhcH/YjgK/YiaL family protein [Mucilaginibacter ginkgonis]
MKNQKLFLQTFLIAVFSLLLFAGSTVYAQKSVVTQRQAEQWVKSRAWAGGLSLKLYGDVNAVTFYKQYHANPALWQKVFAWLKTTKLDTLYAGKHIIDGDKAYANVTLAPSKAFDDTRWESHRNYIDLQYVISGAEKIGRADIDKATVTMQYDDKRDLANYTAEGKFYTATPGTFYLFFPQDAHRPSIKVDGYDMVKKLVVKIRVAN